MPRVLMEAAERLRRLQQSVVAALASAMESKNHFR